MTKELSDYFQQNMTISCFKGKEIWNILSQIEIEIKTKIEAKGRKLVDWDVSINYGIKTGCNDAFVISEEKRNEIIESCTTEKEKLRTADIIRPILRGRDVKRYSYDFADQWLIYLPWHFPLHNNESIKGASMEAEKMFKKQYPALYSYMLSHKSILSKRNKAETNIRYEWYALQRWGANYWEDFSKQKIIWKIIGSNISFAYDDNNMVCNNAINIMTGDESKLVQFLGLMNSSLYNWYLKATTEAEVEGDGIQLYATTLSNTKIRLDFGDKLYDKVIQRVKNEITDEELDAYVYNLFKLNKSEIEFIQSRL